MNTFMNKARNLIVIILFMALIIPSISITSRGESFLAPPSIQIIDLEQELTLELTLDQFNNLIPAHGYTGAYLFFGHGSKGQFKDISEMERATEELVQELNEKHGKGQWLLVFGGDPANAEKPDIGYLVQRVKENHSEVPILAVQADEYKKYGVGDHVDFVYYYPTQRDANGDILYGGFNKSTGELYGSSRFYLGKTFLQSGLSGVVTFGGGNIAKEEVNYGLRNGLTIISYKMAARYAPETNQPNGLLETWLDTQTNQDNLQRRSVPTNSSAISLSDDDKVRRSL